MIKNKLARVVFGSTFLMAMIIPAMTIAQETTTSEVPPDWRAEVARYMAAGLSMTVACLSAGYAQARIGAAGAGTLAERPEAGTNLIVLQALPEVIVLLGFVIAFMIGTA